MLEFYPSDQLDGDIDQLRPRFGVNQNKDRGEIAEEKKHTECPVPPATKEFHKDPGTATTAMSEVESVQ